MSSEDWLRIFYFLAFVAVVIGGISGYGISHFTQKIRLDKNKSDSIKSSNEKIAKEKERLDDEERAALRNKVLAHPINPLTVGGFINLKYKDLDGRFHATFKKNISLIIKNERLLRETYGVNIHQQNGKYVIEVEEPLGFDEEGEPFPKRQKNCPKYLTEFEQFIPQFVPLISVALYANNTSDKINLIYDVQLFKFRYSIYPNSDAIQLEFESVTLAKLADDKNVISFYSCKEGKIEFRFNLSEIHNDHPPKFDIPYFYFKCGNNQDKFFCQREKLTSKGAHGSVTQSFSISGATLISEEAPLFIDYLWKKY